EADEAWRDRHRLDQGDAASAVELHRGADGVRPDGRVGVVHRRLGGRVQDRPVAEVPRDDRDRRAAGPGGDDEVNRELVDLGRCHVRRCCSATAATTAATAAATAAANIDVDCGVEADEGKDHLPGGVGRPADDLEADLLHRVGRVR